MCYKNFLWRKAIRRLIGVCLLFVAVVGQWSWASRQDNFTLQQLFLLLQKTEAVTIQFSEIKTLSFLDTPLKQEGELEFRPPDYLRRELIDPMSEKTVVRGDKMIVTSENGTRKINLTDHPVIGAFISAIRAPLTGKPDEIKNWFEIRLHGTEDEWKLELIPNRAPLSYHLSAMILTGIKDRIHTIETIETDHDSSIMILNR